VKFLVAQGTTNPAELRLDRNALTSVSDPSLEGAVSGTN